MRSPILRIISLAGGLLLTLVACGGGTDEGTSTPTTSSKSVTFDAAKLGGGTLSSRSFEGKDTVLWFWAPWCTICRAEAPNVTATAAAFDGRIEVIGVAGRGEVAAMEDFVSDTDTGSLTHVVDDSGSIWSDYGVAAQPSFAFINDDGSVEVFVGSLGEDGLIEKMDALARS